MGQDLYEQSFRETPFRTAIDPAIREQYAGKGLLIKSNDLWFPREMSAAVPRCGRRAESTEDPAALL